MTPSIVGTIVSLRFVLVPDEILTRFAPECSPVEKKDLWRQCHTAIAQMCKRVRSSSVKRIMQRRSFDHTTELAHHEGKPDNHVESEYTGSETSLSDREDAHGFQEAQAESQEWFPMEESSDITVVHIPSEFQCSEVRTDISAEEDPTPDQSNLPSTESHSGSDASGCSEDGMYAPSPTASPSSLPSPPLLSHPLPSLLVPTPLNLLFGRPKESLT